MPATQTIVLLEWVGVDRDGEEYFDADEIAVIADCDDSAKEKALTAWKKTVGERWRLTPEKVSILCKRKASKKTPALKGRAR
jgi:hypothetical protein